MNYIRKKSVLDLVKNNGRDQSSFYACRPTVVLSFFTTKVAANCYNSPYVCVGADLDFQVYHGWKL